MKNTVPAISKLGFIKHPKSLVHREVKSKVQRKSELTKGLAIADLFSFFIVRENTIRDYLRKMEAQNA